VERLIDHADVIDDPAYAHSCNEDIGDPFHFAVFRRCLRDIESVHD